MSHVRKQIRDALVTLLTGLASSGDRVYAGRVTPFAHGELPAVNVAVGNEEITAPSIHQPALLTRQLEITIECVTTLTDSSDDDLDAMALEVEDAIGLNSTTASLGGILNGTLTPTGIAVERDDDAAVPIGRLTLTYSTAYEVYNDAADVAV
jgi:hypothetical protein